MSLNTLTLAAAWIAAFAILALLAAGWRKPARAKPRRLIDPDRPSARPPLEVEHLPTVAYHAPGPIRRLASGATGVALVLVVGAVLATVVAFAVALTVTHFSDLLKR